MSSPGTIKQDDIGADGRVKRRYEFAEGDAPKAGTRFAIGMLVASAVLAIKQVFFGSSEVAAAATPEEEVADPVSESAAFRAPALLPEPRSLRERPDEGNSSSSVVARKGIATVPDLSNGGPAAGLAPQVQSNGFTASNVVPFPARAVGPISNGSFVTTAAPAASAAVAGGAGSAGNAAAGGGASRAPGDDGDGRSQTNRLPITSGSVVLPVLFVNHAVLIGLSDLLAGAYDPDGDNLQVRNLRASSGEIVAQGDGQWLFTPDRGDSSEVVLTYEIFDGEGIVGQYAEIDIAHPPGLDIVGTDGADVLAGSDGRDRIDAGDGDDRIEAGAGDDLLAGGNGDDIIFAGDGDDIVYAGAGDDIVHGEGGNDLVFAGTGDDVVSGGAGNDSLFGEEGDDGLSGGAGNDALFGAEGDDVLLGGDGADLLDGAEGRDTLDGGDGADVLHAGADDDEVTGGGGDDVLVATEDDGDDRYDGGEGTDTYDASGTTASVTLDLDAGTAHGADVGQDEISNIENAIGGAGADVITGDAQENNLEGRGGDDRISGNGGDDVLSGDAGNDELDGGDGDDNISGGDGDDVIVVSARDEGPKAEVGDPADPVPGAFAEADAGDGGSGTTDETDADTPGLTQSTAALAEVGGGTDPVPDASADTPGLTQSTAALAEVGSGTGPVPDASTEADAGDGGSDTANENENDADIDAPGLTQSTGMFAEVGGYDDGDDTIDGGEGVDTYDLSQTSAAVAVDLAEGTASSAEIGNDGLAGIENVTGGSGDDKLTGDDNANALDGRAGDDVLDGADGDDILSGGNGDDELTGGGGNDELEGQGGDDHFVATAGDGNDAMDGGAGEDTYDLSGTSADAIINLTTGTAESAETGSDTLDDVENVIGGEGDDEITGDGEDNVLAGCDGDDYLSGRDGDDDLWGDGGDDHIDGGDGDDVFHGGWYGRGLGSRDEDRYRDDDDGDDHYEGGYGSDTYDISETATDALVDLFLGYASSAEIGFDDISNMENVIGGSGNDVIVANRDFNVLAGGAGDDIFVFGRGGETGHGRDVILDFEVGDRIDISSMDGDRDTDGVQRMSFRFDQAEFDGSGQCIVRYEDRDEGTSTLVRFRFAFDGDDPDDADFEIEILGRHELNEQSFIT